MAQLTMRQGAARVRDYMTAEPETLESSQTLLDAVLLLRRKDVRHIPILDNGVLAGIVTDRDVARCAPSMLLRLPPQEYNRIFEETIIGKVMSHPAVSTTPEAPLAEAVGVMFRSRLGCLPVLEGTKVVGIITVKDMLRALYDILAPIPSAPGSPQ
jgi:acetoin utilization protein AcuB